MSNPDDKSDDPTTRVEVRTIPWCEYLPKLFRHIVKGCVGVKWYVFGAVLLVSLFTFFWSNWSAFGCIEQDVRLAGWLLQLVGFIQVANGLRNTEKAFGKPSILERTKDYLSSFPTRKARNVTVNLGTGHFTTQASVGGVGVVIRNNPTLEQRVEDIENAVEQIKKTTGKLRRDLSHETSRIDTKINRNVSELKDQANKIEEQLEDLMVGSIHVEWFGVVLFIIGITLASASPELAWLFGHPRSCG
jgi:hypothetical protein